MWSVIGNEISAEDLSFWYGTKPQTVSLFLKSCKTGIHCKIKQKKKNQLDKETIFIYLNNGVLFKTADTTSSGFLTIYNKLKYFFMRSFIPEQENIVKVVRIQPEHGNIQEHLNWNSGLPGISSNL